MAITIVSNPVLSDTTAFQDAPTENHGQSGLIAIDTRSYAYVSIDIPAGITDASRISSAKLKFRAGQAATNSIILQRNNSSWDENTLTWNVKPAGTAIKNIASRAYAANADYEIDLTTEVKNFVSGTWINNGLRMYGGNTSRITMYSGEYSAAPLTLEITYDFPNVSVNVPAGTPGTLSASSPDATVSTVKSPKILAQKMTATALINEASVSTSTGNEVITTQYATTATYGTDPNSPDSTTVNGSVPYVSTFGGKTYFRFDQPAISSNELHRAYIRIFNVDGLSVPVSIVATAVVSDTVNNGTVTSNSPVAKTGTSLETAIPAGNSEYIDIAIPVAKLKDNQAGAAYVLEIDAIATGSVTWAGNGVADNVDRKPKLRVLETPAPTVVVTAEPMLASLAITDANASTGQGIAVNAETLASSFSLINPVLSTEQNAKIDVEYLRSDFFFGGGTVSVGTSVVINAQPMVASAVLSDAVVTAAQNVRINSSRLEVNFIALDAVPSFQKNITINAAVADVAVSSIDPTITILNPDTNIAAHVSLAMAEMVAAEVVAGKSIVAVAEVAEGELTMTMPEFSNASPVLIGAQPMATKLKTLTPRVQGLDIAQFDDEFYNLIRTRVDADDMFLRFREDSGVNQLYAGVTAIDTLNPSIYNYKYNVFGEKRINNEPGMHRSMPFNGTSDYLQQILSPKGDVSLEDDMLYPGSMIFHVRTTQENGPLFYSAGRYNANFSDTAGFGNFRTQISVANGKLAIQSDWQAGSAQSAYFESFTNIADGEWHQIAITNQYKGTESSANSSNGETGGTVIYVDGKLDRRTRFQITIGKPDVIGRRDNSFFRGELSETVHFAYSNVNKDFIEQAYYAFFELNPVRPTPMGMTAAMGNNKARGNAKRILALHHRFLPRRAAYASPEGIDTKGLDTLWNTNPDNALIGSNAYVKYGNIYPPFEGTDNDINKAIEMFPGAKMSFQSVIFGPNGFWRDERTDEPRYINLQTDIDIDDFDAIVVIDWPGIEFVNRYRSTPATNAGAIYDAFLETIKVANHDQGKELMVVSPDMAKELGLVQNFSSRLLNWESGYAIGGYTSTNGKGAGRIPGDYFAAYNNPFTNIEAYNGRETEERRRIAADPSPFGDKANGRGIYYDTHRGQSHRVANTLPGFTDVGGYVLSEETISRRDTSDYKETTQVSQRYLARPSGLRIGDEFLISGPIAEHIRAAELPEISGPKQYNLISFRPEDIRVGMAVLKESAFEYNGTQLRANPYADYATLIAIPKGSVVDGRVINGKIIIMPNDNTSFSEENLITMFQDLSVPNGFTSGGDYLNRPFIAPENDQTKQWQYSSWRAFGGRQDQTSVSQKVISGGNGAVGIQSVSTTFTSTVLSDVDKYPVAVVPIQLRAWNWLVTVEQELEDGDVRVTAGAFTSDLSLPEATTTGQQATRIKAQPMVAIASLSRAAEDNTGENTVLALPMNVDLSMTKLQTRFIAEPMTTTLSLPVPEQADGLDLTETIYLTYAGVQEISLSRKDN